MRRLKEGHRGIFDLDDSDRIEITLPASVFDWLQQKLNGIAKIIVHRKNLLFCIYLVSLAVICTIFYALSFSTNVSGAVDQVEEWEYFRRILSYGLYGGVAIVGLFLVNVALKMRDDGESCRKE